jgi:hypothetical protein
LYVPPQTLSNARRVYLHSYGSKQAAQLEAEIQTYDGFNTCLLCEGDYLAGCSFFQSVLAGSTVCSETLIIDGTSCTNRYDFPIVVIVAIDGYKMSQLLAFAFVRDHTIKPFMAFLHWVKQYVRVGDIHTDSDATLKAFVIDRHDGQLAALREVFSRSRIVFCAKHLGENTRRVMGTQVRPSIQRGVEYGKRRLR